MTYKQEEYTIDGIELTIQQVRGPDSSHGASEPSAWIEGGAAYAKAALEAFDTDVSDKSPYEQVKTVTEWMVHNEVRFCKKCETFRSLGTFVTTGFAGRKCGKCANADNFCEDNPNGDSHEDKCQNPRKKNSARVPTKYKCVHCGRNRRTTPTG